jgi:hypothetical protein
MQSRQAQVRSFDEPLGSNCREGEETLEHSLFKLETTILDMGTSIEGQQGHASRPNSTPQRPLYPTLQSTSQPSKQESPGDTGRTESRRSLNVVPNG